MLKRNQSNKFLLQATKINNIFNMLTIKELSFHLKRKALTI